MWLLTGLLRINTINSSLSSFSCAWMCSVVSLCRKCECTQHISKWSSQLTLQLAFANAIIFGGIFTCFSHNDFDFLTSPAKGRRISCPAPAPWGCSCITLCSGPSGLAGVKHAGQQDKVSGDPAAARGAAEQLRQPLWPPESFPSPTSSASRAQLPLLLECAHPKSGMVENKV